MGTNSSDHEVALGASALGLEDVVDLVGGAGQSADGQVGVIEGGDGALLTNSSDQEEAGLAYALAVDVEGVDVLTDSARVGENWDGPGSDGGGDADS